MFEFIIASPKGEPSHHYFAQHFLVERREVNGELAGFQHIVCRVVYEYRIVIDARAGSGEGPLPDKAVRQRIGSERVFEGHRFTHFHQTAAKIEAFFANRVSGEPLPPHAGGILIGADGIHSQVRALLYPNEGGPVSSGRIKWRGVVEAEPFLDGRTQVTIGSSQCRAVMVAIQDMNRSLGAIIAQST